MSPEKGHIDFTSIIRTLKGHNYKSYLSAELLAGSFPAERAEETINSMRKFEAPSEAG